jgi:hypothetical protein
MNEQVMIYGSNVLGTLGTLLYTYTNLSGNNNDINASHEIIIPSYNSTDFTNTGDIYLYGTVPFRYISIIAGVENITLNTLTFNLCN